MVTATLASEVRRPVTGRGSVLIVDDDVEILESLKQLLGLKLPDTNILTATTGPAGLELVRKHRPSVIISDYRMEGMNGVEFLEKSIEFAPKAARLMMSAYAEPSVAVEALQRADLALMITKPFQLDYFVQLVGTLLKRRAG